MGRLRASLAKNELNRELQSHLAEAERHLERALATCHRVVKEASKDEARSGRRAVEAARVIRSSLSAIQAIGNLESGVDKTDFDLVSESELAKKALEKRNKRRAERVDLIPVRRGVA